MTGAARFTYKFHGRKRFPLVLAALVAVRTMPFGFAAAQPYSYAAIDGRAVPRSKTTDLVPQPDARKFRSTILALDSPSGEPSSRGACDLAKKRTCEELVQDNILWRIDDPDNSASKHWQQKNLDDLCACTTDPYATVNCFQIQVNNNRKSWQEAIATCRAKP
jgi:hypothetical protein